MTAGVVSPSLAEARLITPWSDLAEGLTEKGWAVHEALLPRPCSEGLLALGKAQRADFLRAGTGRGASYRSQSVRGDAIRWLDLDAGTDSERQLGRLFEAIRQDLNARLFLNLSTVEAHLAVYERGEGYARHLDRFRDDDARTVSLVLYLNDNWQPGQDQGALRLHLPEGHQDVFPRLGRAVAFLSGEVEHEVMPTARQRWSVAAWFRRR